MREVLIREYEILISAPSDVFKYVDTIKRAIADYNNDQGVADHIRFVQKNWKEHSIPSYGKSAQAIINEQLTNQAEVVIALFGAKFGEPTEKYSSGTLEEIETVHQNGGRVLTFFLNGKIDLSLVDPDQLKKVNEYKKTYNGLYGEFSTEEELKAKVCVALGRLAIELKINRGNDLKLYAVNENELSDSLIYSQYEFLGSQMMDGRRNNIKKLIDSISVIKIEKPEYLSRISNEYSKYLPEDMLGLSKKIVAESIIPVDFPKKKIVFNKNLIEYAKRFGNDHGVSLPNDFFEIGAAGYSGNNLMGYSLCGKDNEREKAELLLKLEKELSIYYHLIDFLSQYQNKYYLVLAIKNESNIFADDITVKLFLDKESFVKPDTLTLKELDIGDIVKDFPEELEEKNNVDIDDMDYAMIHYPNFSPYINPVTYVSSEPDLEYYQQYYRANNQEIYPFLINEKNGYSVVKIVLSHGVKQFTSQFLCAALMFRKPMDSIKYTITSKSIGHEIHGELKKK